MCSPTSQLPSGYTFVFRLSLVNWLGTVGTSTVTVIKSSSPLLPIFLSGDSVQTVTPSISTSVTATTIKTLTDSCFDMSRVSSFAVSFQWQQVTTNYMGSTLPFALSRVTINVPALQLATGSLTIPPGVLVANWSYVFQVILRATISYTGQATPFAFDSNTHLVLNVAPSPLVARIAGGDRNVWVDTAAPNIVLDASPSFDPDNSAGVMWTLWSCKRRWSLMPCFEPRWLVAVPLLRWSTHMQLSVNATMLANSTSEDPFMFAVRVAKANFTRQAESSPVTLTAMLLPLPTIKVEVAVPTQGSGWLKINPGDRVQLMATITQVGPLSLTYGLMWQCVSANYNLTDRPLTALAAPNLVLPTNTLVGGAQYVFSLILFSRLDPRQRTSSNVSVAVNQVPLGGVCEVSPTVGVALQDTFVFSCSNWVDSPDDAPLLYQFAVIDNLLTKRNTLTLRDFQAVSQLSTKLQAGAPLYIQVSIRDRFGAQSQVVVTVTVTQPDVSTATAVSDLVASSASSLSMVSNAGDLSATAQVHMEKYMRKRWET